DTLRFVTPDRVDQVAALHEARPARRLITAREHEFRIRKLRGFGRDGLGMVRPQIVERGRVAGVDRLQQILRLVPELIEIRADGKTTGGHTSLLHLRPMSARFGPKEVRENQLRAVLLFRWTQSCPRTWRRPVRQNARYHRAAALTRAGVRAATVVRPRRFE